MTRFSPERWKRIREIFDAALEFPETEREAFLSRMCKVDEVLRDEVLSLLASHRDDDSLVGSAVREAATRALLPLRVGTALGPYRLLELIGEGGMGSVYLAERSDEAFHMRVAIKVVRGGLDSARALERFQEERRILAALEHPNIARVLDGGSTTDGLPYLVMEHVAGTAIGGYCERRRAGIRERIGLFRKICDAVDHAHRRLVVHRDIKPANVLVPEDGEPKLLDFGIAKLLDDLPERSRLTLTDTRPMTLDYASPEQIRGEPITTATDVHALGILLYELLTGRHPFSKRTLTPKELEEALLERDPESPSTAITRTDDGFDPRAASRTRATSPGALRRELAGDLDNIILKALAKEPERRYPSAAELAADLGRYLDGHPVLARRATFSYRAGKFLRRNAIGVSIAGAFLATIGAAGTMSTRAYLRADRMRIEAETQRDRLEEVNAFLAATFQAASPEQRQSKEEITAREILDAGAARVAEDLKDSPEIAASLQAEIGKRYFDLGLLDRAEELERSAVAGFRSTGGLNSPEGATALTYLGQTLSARDNHEEAIVVLREVIDVSSHFKERHADIAMEARQSLANAYMQLGEFEEAAGLFEYLLALLVGETYRTDPDFAMRRSGAANDLGLLRERTGNYEDAERLLRMSLEIAISAKGEEHSEVGERWANLAFILNRAGKMEEGVEAARRALAIHESILGDDHLQTANSRLNLADALAGIGRFDEAETYYPRVLDVYRKVFGERHPRIGTVQNNIANALLNRGEPARAIVRFEEARDIYAEAFGANHPYTAIAQHNLARALYGAGRFDDAERVCRETLALRHGIFEEDHPDVARSESLLAMILREKGAPAEAKPHLLEAVRISRNVLSAGHPVRLGAERGLARCLFDLGRYDDAERLFLAVRNVTDSLRGPDSEESLAIAIELDSLRAARSFAE